MRCSTCNALYRASEPFCPIDGGALVEGDDPLVGCTIEGRYFVRRLIGRGGMGAVYEAEHVAIGRRVAIKFLLRDRADDEALARFRREARAASRITHDHVVRIFDVGNHDGLEYIAMEYVEGVDLHRLLQRDGRIAPARAVALGTQLLHGLQAIHDASVVHRDIKPGNLAIEAMGGGRERLKIMDFGISKPHDADVHVSLTTTGHVVGTPQYMAPEQISDAPVDHRADLYAAGVTLFQMLTGELPFGETGTTELAAQHLFEKAPSLVGTSDLPRPLAVAIAKALRKDPDARFQSAAEFAAALAGDTLATADPGATIALRPKRVSVGPPLASAPTRDSVDALIAPVRRRTWPMLVGVSGVALAAVALVVVMREGAAGDAAPMRAAAPVVKPRAAGALELEGLLEVTTNPAGARIYVDGVDRGSSPVTLSLPVGTHRLEARLGSARASEQIDVGAGLRTRTLTLHD